MTDGGRLNTVLVRVESLLDRLVERLLWIVRSEVRTQKTAKVTAAGYGRKIINLSKKLVLGKHLYDAETHGGRANPASRKRQPNGIINLGGRALWIADSTPFEDEFLLFLVYLPRGKGIREISV